MAYCVYYNSVPVKLSAKKKSYKLWIWLLVLGCFSLALAAIPGFSWMLTQIIFPGFSAQSAEALETMVGTIAGGTPFGEAIESFCRQIMAGING